MREIGKGLAPNDKTGTPARQAADIININFQLLDENKLDKGNYTGTAETLSYQAKIYENGDLQIFRKPGTIPDPTNKEPNIGDWCIGFVEGQFINAEYLGPNKLLLTSYNI